MARPAGLLAALLAATPVPGHHAAAESPTVAVTAIVEHAELDAVRDGIRDGLVSAGFIPGESLNFVYESADADPAKTEAIATRLAASDADIIVALSAPSASAIIAAISDRPVIVSAISGAAAGRILAASRGRDRNVAGLVQSPPVREQLALARTLLPDVATVLVPFDRTDPAAKATADALARPARQLDLDLTPIPLRPGQDPAAALRRHAAPGAVIFLPQDAGLADLTADIAALAGELGLPFIAGSGEAVAQGAAATVAFDPYAVGLQTGAAIARILGGARPRDIALQAAEATYLVVNRPVLEQLALPALEAILERADLVYE